MDNEPPQFIQSAGTGSGRNVTLLRKPSRIRYARVIHRNVDFAVVAVNEHVIDEPGQCAATAARAYLILHIPILLVSLVPYRAHGRAEFVRMLEGMDVARLPWRVHTVAA